MGLKKLLFIALVSFLILLFSGCGANGPTTTTGGTTTPPSIPTPPIASATAGNSQNTITWPAVTGATSYNIYWTSNPAASTTVRASGSKMIAPPSITSPYNHTGLINNTTYYYVVTAVNGAGESNPSNTVAATPLGSLPLATPASLSATAISTTSSAQINLNWTAAAGATSYNIYSATTPNPAIIPANLIATTASTSFSHIGLNVNTTYYYKVTAIINASESNPSNVASALTPPFIPTGLAATASGTTQINLSWNPASGATGYNIYYSTTSNPITKLNSTPISVTGTTFSHSGLSPGTTHYYAVAATNGTIIGDLSATVSATTTQIGVNWVQANLPINSTNVIFNKVTYGNNLFVAVGYNPIGTGAIYTSSDAVNWYSRVSNTTNALRNITYSGNKFVAVGDIGTIVESADGISWTNHTPLANTTYSTYSLYGATYGTQFVTAGSLNLIVSSADGTNWINQNRIQINISGGPSSLNLKYLGNQYIAVGNFGNIYTSVSPASTSWTLVAASDPVRGASWMWNSIAYSGSRYVVVGNNSNAGLIMSSPTAGSGSWTPPSPTAALLYDITWTGSQFVAVGSGGTLLTSPEGVTWASKNINPNGLSGITSGQNKLVAVGGGGTILVSQ